MSPREALTNGREHFRQFLRNAPNWKIEGKQHWRGNHSSSLLPGFLFPIGVVGVFRSTQNIQLTKELRNIVFRKTQMERLTSRLREQNDDLLVGEGKGERLSATWGPNILCRFAVIGKRTLRVRISIRRMKGESSWLNSILFLLSSLTKKDKCYSWCGRLPKYSHHPWRMISETNSIRWLKYSRLSSFSLALPLWIRADSKGPRTTRCKPPLSIVLAQRNLPYLRLVQLPKMMGHRVRVRVASTCSAYSKEKTSIAKTFTKLKRKEASPIDQRLKQTEQFCVDLDSNYVPRALREKNLDRCEARTSPGRYLWDECLYKKNGNH